MYSSPMVVLAGSSWLSVVPTATRMVPCAAHAVACARDRPSAAAISIEMKLSHALSLLLVELKPGRLRVPMHGVRIDRARHEQIGHGLVFVPKPRQCRRSDPDRCPRAGPHRERPRGGRRSGRPRQRLEFAACLVAGLQAQRSAATPAARPGRPRTRVTIAAGTAFERTMLAIATQSRPCASARSGLTLAPLKLAVRPSMVDDGELAPVAVRRRRRPRHRWLPAACKPRRSRSSISGPSRGSVRVLRQRRSDAGAARRRSASRPRSRTS